jgi:hypothetical protein
VILKHPFSNFVQVPLLLVSFLPFFFKQCAPLCYCVFGLIEPFEFMFLSFGSHCPLAPILVFMYNSITSLVVLCFWNNKTPCVSKGN